MYCKTYVRCDWSVDVFNQSKYMFNGVPIEVRMIRCKDSFVLMTKSYLQSRHIIGKTICEKMENHTKVSAGHMNVFSNEIQQNTL